MGWNYAIIARKFVDNKALDEYLSIIRHLDFIEEIREVTTLVPNYEFIMTTYNHLQSLWKNAGGTLGFLPHRPFKPNITSSTTMLTTNHGCRNRTALGSTGTEEIHTISLFKIVNQDEMNVYQNFFLWKVFPAFSLRLGYNGKPESPEWSNFVVLKYNGYEDFCELVSSTLFEKYAKHRQNAMS